MKKVEEVINMAKYSDSKPINSKCRGCAKVFDWSGPEGSIVIEKCLTYSNPDSKWPKEGQKFATHVVTVRNRDEKGKAVGLVEKELPKILKICPMATHITLPEIVDTVGKTRVGQQKQR